VLTEWNEFRGLDLDRIRQTVAQPKIIDLRNIFNPEEVSQRGFSYTSIGRPNIGPAV
jgi:UDPglucose 6-dehydrogenase